jgi:hypothetical protein
MPLEWSDGRPFKAGEHLLLDRLLQSTLFPRPDERYSTSAAGMDGSALPVRRHAVPLWDEVIGRRPETGRRGTRPPPVGPIHAKRAAVAPMTLVALRRHRWRGGLGCED